MKKIQITSLLALLLASFILCGASCPNAQRNSYTTISSVELTASAAYDAYVDQVIAGNVSTNGLPQISEKFNQIQIAGRLAAQASEAGKDGLAPATLISEAAQLTELIATFNKPKPK